MGRWILVLLTLPMIILGWAWILILRLVGAVDSLRFEPFLVLTAIRSTRQCLFKEFSFTFGRAIIYAAGRRARPGLRRTSIQEHEHVHIRQSEDAYVACLLIGVGVTMWTHAWLLGLLIWSVGPYITWLSQAVCARARGGNFYWDAENERSAYAQTDRVGNSSWLDMKRAGSTERTLPSLLVEDQSLLEAAFGCIVCESPHCQGNCDRGDGLPPVKLVLPKRSPKPLSPGFIDSDDDDPEVFGPPAPCAECGTEHCICEPP